MRILLIGDIVGRPGRQIVIDSVKKLREQHQLDFIIANAENADRGSGLGTASYQALMAAGLDGITLGDHIYKRMEIAPLLESAGNIVKPANYPPAAPGKPWMVLERKNLKLGVLSLHGRVYMKNVDCPWLAADRVLAELPDDLNGILVDFHAEATGEMQIMGRHLDGRVSAVLGTHTHVTTADEQIYPGGTAFQCDVGMTGPHASIIGRRIDRVLEATLTFKPRPFDVAKGDVRLCGTIVSIDDSTRQATAIERLVVSREDVDAL